MIDGVLGFFAFSFTFSILFHVNIWLYIFDTFCVAKLLYFGFQACNFIEKETLAQVFFCEFCEISKGKDTPWKFSFKAFHQIQFQGHFIKHEILSWNTFILVSNIHCVCFSPIKKIVFAEKRYRAKFNRKDIV